MTSSDHRPRSIARPAIVVAIVGLLAAIAAIWFVGRGAPDAVTIDAAADAIDATADDTEAPDTEATADDADADASTSPEGTWAVDTTVGSISVEDTTGTFVGFRIVEELASVGVTEAVGRTPDVDGSITIADGTLTAAEFTADLTSIVSNESRRDDRIQSALETATYPVATFVLTEPVTLGDIEAGEVIDVEASGTLTIHGVSNEVSVPLQAVLQDGTAVVTASFDVTFADYGVQVPTAPMVVSVEDHGQVELQLYLTPA